MKRILALIFTFTLCLSLVFTLASCDKNNTDDGTSQTDKGDDTPKPEPKPDPDLPCEVCGEGGYVAEVIKPATTFEDGETKYTCDNCGDSYTVTTEATGIMKILIVGDASCGESLDYLPSMLKSQGVNTTYVGMLNYNYSTGASLADHWLNIEYNRAEYTYFTATNGTYGDFLNNKSFLDGLTAEDWDYIVIGQSVAKSGLNDSYSALDSIVSYVDENKTNDSAKILWNMVWAYHGSNTSKGFKEYDYDQAKMYAGIVSACENTVAKNEKIDGIIPVGTAIQNIRGTFVGDTVTDATSIQLGTDIGKYMFALAWCKALTGTEIDKISIDGVPQEISSRMHIVKTAVKSAFTSPFEINVPEVKSVKLLVFGNSYSNDAITYLSKIFLSAGYDEIIIGSIVDSGCDINHHWWNIDPTLEDYHPASKYDGMTGVEGTASCTIYINGKNTSTAGSTLVDRYINTIKAYDWDYISIQHGPNTVEKIETYSYLSNLIAFTKEHLQSEHSKFVFNMIWKYNDNQSLTNQTQYQYDKILEIAQSMIASNPEFENRILPAVTFRQNLVSSYLNDIDISRDYGHMGLTLGRYALGLLWYCYFTGGSVDDVTYIPTPNDVSASDKELSAHKDHINHTKLLITEQDMLVVREAIKNALEKPFEITPSVYTTKDAN